MKKIFFTLLITVMTLSNVYSQTANDPGFGDEGGGDAQDAPGAPIDDYLNHAILFGIMIGGYYLVSKKNTKTIKE